MTEPYRVDVFLYDACMSRAALEEAGIRQPRCEAARLPGYRLEIAPLANLVDDAGSQAYGILARLSHAELDRLYGGQAARTGYRPEAVLAFTLENTLMPALCYRAHGMPPAAPERSYVDVILQAAREYGFPAEYIEDLEALR